MTWAELRDWCLSLPGAEETFPFEPRRLGVQGGERQDVRESASATSEPLDDQRQVRSRARGRAAPRVRGDRRGLPPQQAPLDHDHARTPSPGRARQGARRGQLRAGEAAPPAFRRDTADCPEPIRVVDAQFGRAPGDDEDDTSSTESPHDPEQDHSCTRAAVEPCRDRLDHGAPGARGRRSRRAAEARDAQERAHATAERAVQGQRSNGRLARRLPAS